MFIDYKLVDEARKYKNSMGEFFLDKTIVENDVDSQVKVVGMLYNFLSFTIEMEEVKSQFKVHQMLLELYYRELEVLTQLKNPP